MLSSSLALAFVLTKYWHRLRRLVCARLLRSQADADAAGTATCRKRNRWLLSDLHVLRHADYLFAFKLPDLHIDHPAEPVTLQTQLGACHPEHVDPTTAFGFRLAHQLDYATSGVLCVALSKRAAKMAAACFAGRTARKCYLALVHGHVQWVQAVCERAIGLDESDERGFRMAVDGAPGKHCGPARTACALVGRGYLDDGRPASKLLLRPLTGRRHQLRVHCLHLGHGAPALRRRRALLPVRAQARPEWLPIGIVGDVAYTGDTAAPRMMLHAWLLKLPLAAGSVTVETSDPFLSYLHAAAPPLGTAARDNVGEAERRVFLSDVDAEDPASILSRLRGPGG